MNKLSGAERDCLRFVLAHPGGRPPGCSDALLDLMVRKGLLERVALAVLPLMPPRQGYRLTYRGEQALRDAF